MSGCIANELSPACAVAAPRTNSVAYSEVFLYALYNIYYSIIYVYNIFVRIVSQHRMLGAVLKKSPL